MANRYKVKTPKALKQKRYGRKRIYYRETHNLREGICALLDCEKQITVTGSSADYSKGNSEIGLADVLLIEHDLDLEDALDRVYEIQREHPKLKILLLSDRPEDPDFMNQMLIAGISGYMTKNAGSEELAYGIKKVAEDGMYICTEFILKFLQTLPLVSESRLTKAIRFI